MTTNDKISGGGEYKSPTLMAPERREELGLRHMFLVDDYPAIFARSVGNSGFAGTVDAILPAARPGHGCTVAVGQHNPAGFVAIAGNNRAWRHGQEEVENPGIGTASVGCACRHAAVVIDVNDIAVSVADRKVAYR